MPHTAFASPLPRGLILALSALGFAGCSSSGSSTEDAALAPAPPAVDTSPLPAAEVSSVDTDGWIWDYRSEPPRALFGPPASQAAVVVSCSTEGDGGNRVEYTLYAPAPEGGSTELVIAGNGDRSTVPLGVTESELAAGPVWHARAEIGPLEAPFSAGDGPVSFTVVGGPTWVVPDPHPVRALIEACRG